MDITHDNVCSSMLSCFYSRLLSTGRPISSYDFIILLLLLLDFSYVSENIVFKTTDIWDYIVSASGFLDFMRSVLS